MKSIFLSYSSKDKEFVIKIATFIKERGIRVWIDEGEILIGDSLLSKISEGIHNADYLGVILSPNSINSNWVKNELEMAMNQEINEGKTKVLPLLIRDCEIPNFLKHKKYGDLRTADKILSGMKELLKILEGKTDKKNNEIKRGININKLKEVTEYAKNVYGGMGFSNKSAADFGFEWCKNYEGKYDFEKFKELFKYANNTYGGLGLSKTDAKEWALKALEEGNEQ